MRYLRLFSVSLLLTIAITGCHRRQVRAVPPPQAQAPIVTTLPPMPPLTLPDVEQAKAEPAKPAAPPAAPVNTQKKQVARKRHHRNPRKPETEKPELAAEGSATVSPAGPATSTTATAAPKTAVLGQLSADDAAAGPDQKEQTRRIIQHTENRLKKLSSAQRATHKNDIAQVDSFLKQAEQAWSMNDLVGAQTLANKAKILMDDLSK